VLKTHRGDKGAIAWAAMNALWDRRESWEHAVRLAEPLGYLPDERVLVQGPVPGDVTLKDLARQAIRSGAAADVQQLRDELARTAFALATLHGSGASYAGAATFEDELAQVVEVLDGLSLSVPHLAAAAAPLLRHLADGAAAHRPDPAVPAHHDFRPDQVLVDRDGVGFIDFDSACTAEPALDLGRFRAALRDIGISALELPGDPLPPPRGEAGLSLLDDLCEHFLAEYQRHASVSRARVLLWESWDLMNMVLHAWTKVRVRRARPRLAVLMHQLRTADA
jgi:aminoglycoside phosphotransferase (APT) family kinase protein